MIENYLKIALRNLWRKKWFSIINILGLAIGLTAGFLISLYVSFQFSYDNFHTKGERIYRVVADLKTPSEEIRYNIPALAVPPALEKEFPEISSAVRLQIESFLVKNENFKFNETDVISADSAFFKLFDFKLLQGNPSTVLKEPFSLVMSETAAKKYFGSEDPIGRTVEIMDQSYPAKVTGIMRDIPPNSHIQGDMVLSMSTYSTFYPTMDQDWSNYSTAAYILLKPKVDPENLKSKFPDFLERNSGKQMRASQMFARLDLEKFEDVYLYSDRDANGEKRIKNLYVFSLIAVFIIFLACINFINLTTARSVERAREVGIRKVIGAEKQQLALQFIGEAIIISFLAFLITLILTAFLLPYFNSLAGEVVLENLFDTPLYLLLLAAVAIGIGVISGIYPALVLSSFKPIQVLKGNFSGGNQGIFLRKALVTGQFTISIALIIGTLIVYNQMNFMRNQNLGFNQDHIMVLRVNKPQIALQQHINSIPNVISTSFGSSVPGGGNFTAYSEIENSQGDLQIANLPLYYVDSDFIPHFEMEVVAGRPFSRNFASDTTQALILNEKAVALFGYSSPEDAIGKKFKQWGREGQIIGIIKDFHFNSLQSSIRPLSLKMEPSNTTLLTVKIAPKNIPQTIAAIENYWNNVLPDQPFEFYFLDEFFNRQYINEQRFGNLFLNFSILAILISCLGLLGLVSYSTLQRRQEIGIRKIIGSSVTSIVKLLSLEFIKLVGIAFLIATPIAWIGMYHWLQDFAYRIEIEWWIFAIAGMAAMLIAFITVSFQAIRAATADPVKSLRSE